MWRPEAGILAHARPQEAELTERQPKNTVGEDKAEVVGT